MLFRVFEEDLSDPAFLRHFDELQLTEAQSEGLKKVRAPFSPSYFGGKVAEISESLYECSAIQVLFKITKPLEELIAESRARRVCR